MKSWWLLCLCLVCLIIQITGKHLPPTTDTFMFHFCDSKGKRGRVTFSEKGTIGKKEKVVFVPVKIGYCSELQDVKVEVDNPVGPPVVTLDRENLIVTIKYRPKQESSSKFLVSAKTIPIKGCKS
ncbi:hypothetical protein ABMA28_016450 [Loxostege sticticalis]|uniref:Uncharacterized protein n=1 Tax=Loxostege sticticalis TaxID=481309 RepID=A0ABD0T8X7_LOXSC